MVKPQKKRRVVKFLLQNNWHLARDRAGHEIWISENGKDRIALPHSTTISPGIIRQLNTKIKIPATWL